MIKTLKTILPRSLMGRSLLILIVPIVLIQVFGTYLFFERHWNRTSARLAFAVAGEIAGITDYIENGRDGTAQDRARQVAAFTAQHLDFLITFAPEAPFPVSRGEKPFSLDFTTQAKENVVFGFLSRALDEQVRRPYAVEMDLGEKWVEIAIQLENGMLRVSLPQRRLFTSSGYIFLLWMFGISIVLLVVAILFMRNQIRPIRRLAVAAERFGKGRDIPGSFKPEGAREVRQAAEAFLDMQGRIRRQIEQRTAMLSGVSHDLRTPLTRMKLQTAMMQACPDVAALEADIADMERMIDAYLDFVRGEGEEQTLRVSLTPLLERLAENERRAGGTVFLESADGLSLFLKPLVFERCLANLLGNARKYAGNIWISAGKDEDRIVITIDDDGPGIAPEEREAVFKPFYRVDPSRNADTGGVGLGLPIAQDVIHAHGGEITLDDSPHGGLRVTVHLPC
ncbi:MAG: HAMP domain-containing protein [Alphaproteobacteria bacterium]|nr:HAMP domain-containing protein [Alphaproteobacteria bacterium]